MCIIQMGDMKSEHCEWLEIGWSGRVCFVEHTEMVFHYFFNPFVDVFKQHCS